MNPFQVRFCADRMLGRLARLLRLLGYDTFYANDKTPAELLEIARREDRTLLTRGETARRFPHADKILSIRSELAPAQLGEVVRQLDLDVRSGLWTRCTLCNDSLARVEKASVEASVKPRILLLYDEFWRCAGCGHVYWRGSHTERILRNLASVLGEPSPPV